MIFRSDWRSATKSRIKRRTSGSRCVRRRSRNALSDGDTNFGSGSTNRTGDGEASTVQHRLSRLAPTVRCWDPAHAEGIGRHGAACDGDDHPRRRRAAGDAAHAPAGRRESICHDPAARRPGGVAYEVERRGRARCCRSPRPTRSAPNRRLHEFIFRRWAAQGCRATSSRPSDHRYGADACIASARSGCDGL